MCRETDHLARNCKLVDKGAVNTSSFIVHRNSREVNSAVLEKTAFLGTGAGAGADEDDFHTLKRNLADVDKEQKAVERTQKSRHRNQAQPQKKKVVSF